MNNDLALFADIQKGKAAYVGICPTSLYPVFMKPGTNQRLPKGVEGGTCSKLAGSGSAVKLIALQYNTDWHTVHTLPSWAHTAGFTPRVAPSLFLVTSSALLKAVSEVSLRHIFVLFSPSHGFNTLTVFAGTISSSRLAPPFREVSLLTVASSVMMSTADTLGACG